MIRFNIAPTTGWNAKTNEYNREIKRRADAYVFCILGTPEDLNPDPLDLEQWRFYILATKVLDKARPNQKTIGLKPLLTLGPVKSSYAGLAVNLRSLML